MVPVMSQTYIFIDRVRKSANDTFGTLVLQSTMLYPIYLEIKHLKIPNKAFLSVDTAGCLYNRVLE